MLSCQFTKRLGSFALQFELKLGDQVAALFGPSGSGKSVAMQCIAGLIKPDSGRIEIGGQTVFDSARRIDLPPQRRRVGYVFQSYALFPHLSAADNIGYGLTVVSHGERAERIREVVRAVRLEGLEHRRPDQLSGGQQQRVALARALVTRPAILLLDEPFAALDSIIRGQLHHELLRVLRELPVPTLLVTHQLDEAYALSREIAVLDAGQVLQAAHRDEVYYRPACRRVAALVGATNILPGTVTAVDGDFTYLDGPGVRLFGNPGAFVPGQPVACAIRPEHVMLVRKDRAEENAGPGETRLDGMVVDEVAYGGHVSILFRPDAVPGGAELPDIHITLATYMYRRLGLDRDPRQTIALKARFLHIMPA